MKKRIDPAVLKGLTILVLIGLLLIPLGMITHTIEQRRWRSLETETTLLKEFGGELKIIGPLLGIPYENDIFNKKGELVETEKSVAYFLPKTSSFESELEPEIRKRGIYSFLLYKGDLEFSSYFELDFSRIDSPIDRIKWEEAYIEFEFSDMKGLASPPEVYFGEKKLSFEAELKSSGFMNNHGIIAGVNIDPKEKEIALNGHFDIQGGKSINFVPLASENRYKIESSWEYPSFFGGYLPKERSIEEGVGFTSEYHIMSYSSGFKPAMTSDEILNVYLSDKQFGIKFLFPVDIYQLSERSVKYGLLFIVLPFLVFFLLEIFTRIKVHPFQYLFVGIASSLFFLLLISISEHFSFLGGYILGALSVSLLITYYAIHFLKSFKRGVSILPIMILSYIAMYFMINSQDYALLMGSIGIFIIVGGIMVTTRKVDWYKLGERND